VAHLVKQTTTSHVDAAGKRVPKGTPGAKKVRAKSAKWYGVGIPGHPPRKRVPLATDKAAARRMLEQLVRDAEQGKAGMPDREAGRVRLADHLDAFARDLARGLASRSRKQIKKPPGPKQVRLCVGRVRDLLAGCGFTHPSDLTDDAPGRVADFLQSRLGRPVVDGGMSHQTATFYLAAIGRFAWWLAKKRLPVRPDLFAEVPGFDPTGNRVHARRAVPPDELARVLDAALASPKVFRRTMAGRDRYHVYLTAFSTGFRVGELAAMTPECFALDGDAPAIVLSAKLTKNRKAATIPLQPAVAVQLRTYLAGKPAGKPVWPGTWSGYGAMMLRDDLEAAGVPYRVEGPNGPEYADFHALRTSFVTALAAAGVGPKELQELARHSDPRLTLGVYTRSRPEQLAAAVGRLAVPGAAADGGLLDRMTREQKDATIAVCLTVLSWIFAPPGVSGGVSGPGAAANSPKMQAIPRRAKGS
jgi:integrase